MCHCNWYVYAYTTIIIIHFFGHTLFGRKMSVNCTNFIKLRTRDISLTHFNYRMHVTLRSVKEECTNIHATLTKRNVCMCT